jgi:predicted DNA-binding transcriptional regulator AlpA
MRYLNAAEAARALGIGDKTIRRWLKAGRFPSAIVRDNGEYAIPETEIESLRQHRIKYMHTKVTNLDQSPDVSALAEKLAALEQEIAELKKAQSSPHQSPNLAPYKDEVSNSTQQKRSQNRIVAPSEGMPSDLPEGTIKLVDFVVWYGLSDSTVGRWIEKGLKGEKLKTVARIGANGRPRHYLTPALQIEAIDFLKRHGKLEYILASKFAEYHGVDPDEFEAHMKYGLGPGLIGTCTDMIPERDRVPNSVKAGQFYLTSEQQAAALKFWECWKVQFSQCDRPDCPCKK